MRRRSVTDFSSWFACCGRRLSYGDTAAGADSTAAEVIEGPRPLLVTESDETTVKGPGLLASANPVGSCSMGFSAGTYAALGRSLRRSYGKSGATTLLADLRMMR